MNPVSFKSYLATRLPAEADRIAQLPDECQHKTIARNHYLLRAGEHCKHAFFVERGLLRQYSLDDKGKEHILQFAPEGWFMTDRESQYCKSSSIYFIQALEDTEVLLIDETLITQLSEAIPAFTALNNRLLHNHIRHLQHRVSLLLGAPAEERYLDFIKTYPDLLLRIPQTMVASYLGITPETLSRVRREMADRHRNRRD